MLNEKKAKKQEKKLRKKLKREEQDRILADLDSKIDKGLFENYSQRETIDEIVCIVKDI